MAAKKPGLTADAIRNARDFKIDCVDVPAWGGSVYVRSIPLRDLKVFYDASGAAAEGTFGPDEMVRVVAICLCDESGVRLFSDDQVSELAEKDPDAIRVVFDAAVKIIGLSRSGIEDEKKG